MHEHLEKLPNLRGWRHDPAMIHRVCAAAGVAPSLYDAAPHLRGLGEGKRVILADALRQVEGRWIGYPAQTRGTCVGRAGGRAGDILAALEVMEGAEWIARFSSEAVYGFARVEIGGRRIPGDGAVVAYAVEAVRKLGMLPRQSYQADGHSFTLPETDDDSLAAQWGRTGVPDWLEPFCAKHLVQDWTPIRSYGEARDALAGGFVVWFGTSQAFWRGLPAVRDDEGFLRPQGRTAHSWLAVGVDDDSRRPHLILDNRSWGDDWIRGPMGQYPIPPGCYRCDADAFERVIRAGEAYAVSDIAGFEPRLLDYLLI